MALAAQLAPDITHDDLTEWAARKSGYYDDLFVTNGSHVSYSSHNHLLKMYTLGEQRTVALVSVIG